MSGIERFLYETFDLIGSLGLLFLVAILSGIFKLFSGGGGPPKGGGRGGAPQPKH
jgi:hypothetical protein